MHIKKPGTVREYWKRLMESSQKKMSEGSRQLAMIIPWARKDNWRRKDKVQHSHQHNKKD